jgi:hypothetical protein
MYKLALVDPGPDAINYLINPCVSTNMKAFSLIIFNSDLSIVYGTFLVKTKKKLLYV